jgi:predicted nucleic acid-binding Zn ribbon protein
VSDSDVGGTADGAGDGDAPELAELRGPDLVRAALAQARASARAKGLAPGAKPSRRRRAADDRSGSGPDARDPLLVGAAIRRLVAERGWEDTTTAAGVIANWDKLVGPEIADHSQPESLVDGVLVLVAESTAWATQLRLLTRTMQALLRDRVGDGVVTSIVVRGPAQPDWRKGPRRVQGPGARGPRDTYG